jgi:uncharacterized protein YodC (DUF2158 family)
MAFKAGDVVKVKAGGPLMTVQSIELSDVECIWFVKETLKVGRFVPATLEPVPDEELFSSKE